jgi:phosphoribosylformylglycinamidine synthase
MMLKFYKSTGTVSDPKIYCFYVQVSNKPSESDMKTIYALLEPNKELLNKINHTEYVEWGPRIEMVTPWCTNALNVLKKCGVNCIDRIEKSNLISKDKFKDSHVDPMTETVYPEELKTFHIRSDMVKHYNVDSIDQENDKLKLGFDKADIKFYNELFSNLGRHPTNIELYDLAQSNSEHSRHWFFRGSLIDHTGLPIKKSLFDQIKDTQKYSNNRSVVAFSDNSSALYGFDDISVFQPTADHSYRVVQKAQHPTLTAETHNFPTGIAPFPGAATGTGGRIRDGQAIGRGGYVVAGSVGYCVGDCFDSDYKEKNIRTLIEASNGASDYGNKFGEPVISGFCRSWGLTVEYEDSFTERREWVKPIMFSSGVGLIDGDMIKKKDPKVGMYVAKLGGPAYKIGIGGGAASSRGQDTRNNQEDFNAVQRGDPQMENRLNRVVRACLELGEKNPIQSIHDQGAGGTANVTKEIVYPAGADIYLGNIPLGDKTMSALEIWVSEYQEQDTILVLKEDVEILKSIAKRENLEIAIIGEIRDNGHIQVFDRDGITKVVDLPLSPVLGDGMPQKEYKLERISRVPISKDISQISFVQKLYTVLRQPSVGSKRFLTNKVDRSVTGLISQQQCIGPLHTPLSNFSSVAHSYYGYSGTVSAIGEQPIKALINPAAMGRLAIGEMLTNMIFSHITALKDIRCSGNWMWPNASPDEKDALYQACTAMCEITNYFGFAFDGGKDSLSMSYTDHKNKKTIKCPQSLVITGYAPTYDVRKKVTPDFKKPGSYIVFVDLSGGQMRMGASTLYTSHSFLGSNSPDINDPRVVVDCWNIVQQLVDQEMILSGHDRSDGGLITSLLESAFSGNLGLIVDLSHLMVKNYTDFLFNEELGIIMEIAEDRVYEIIKLFNGIAPIHIVGRTVKEDTIKIPELDFENKMSVLRDVWEEPSYQFDLYQTNESCCHSEYTNMARRKTVKYRNGPKLNLSIPKDIRRHKIAIIREEGTNGDRELGAAFHMAGFDVFDICINDLIQDDNLQLDSFRGIAFAGGFSYADVFGAGRGWYQVIKNNKKLDYEFDRFYQRTDTFSIGICNGCQLMSLLGWIPGFKMETNSSGRFESRFPHLLVNKSNSIMLKGVEETLLGMWVAHGEGRFVLTEDIDESMIPLQYTDDDGVPTEEYPFNPNGSPRGVAGLVSKNGRHLAMMPHPERCFLDWQLPYSQYTGKNYTAWFALFLNAYEWCCN